MIGSQAAYARHAGISKQAVNKMVKQGKIPLTQSGKVDFAEADYARQQNGDPSRRMPKSPSASVPDMALADPAPETGGISYSKARTAREAYQAKMAQLEYERQMGKWLPRQEIEDAMVAAGRKIRQGMDGVIRWADEMDAAARNGGSDAVTVMISMDCKG